MTPRRARRRGTVDRGARPPVASPLAAWPAFMAEVGRRLDAGRRTYGDRSFHRAPAALVAEVEEELLDVAAWSFILWHRVRTLRGKGRNG